jgi:tetratricopeptide (TPR) repeat protein
MFRAGTGWLVKHQATGETAALDEAIVWMRRARAALPSKGADEEPEGRVELALGNCLRLRYQDSGELVALDEAIGHFRRSVALTEDLPGLRGTCKNNLGHALRLRYEATGDSDAGQEAVSVLREVAKEAAHSQEQAAIWLGNLGETLLARCVIGGAGDLLSEAVDLLQRSLEATPPEHLSRPEAAGQLSYALTHRWRVTGAEDDLRQAVRMARIARSGPTTGIRDPRWAANLASLLVYVYEETGEKAVLDEAVGLLDGILDTVTNDSTADATRSVLARALLHRYEGFADAGDLDRARALAEQALAATSESAPSRCVAQGNLGRIWRIVYDRTGDRAALDRAVDLGRQAVREGPTTDTEYLGRLSDLGGALSPG